MNDNGKKYFFSAIAFFLGFTLVPVISYVRELLKDYNYPPMTSAVRYTAILIFCLLFALYHLFLKKEGCFPVRQSLAWRFVPAFLVGTFLCCIYPIFSIDLFEYIMRGRILGVYHANPYIFAPENFKNDLLYDVIFWKYQPMIYGPVWEYLVTAAVIVARESVFFSQFLVKFILLFFHLSLSLVIYGVSRELGLKDRGLLVLAYLFNPYVLVMALVDGHMDTVMMFFLVASVLMLYKKKTYLSFLFLALSALTKYFPIIFLPFYLIYLRDNTENRARYFAEVLISFALMMLTAVLLYKPLWAGLETFSALKVVGAGFDTNAFPYIPYKALSLVWSGISQSAFRCFSYLVFFIMYFLSLIFFFWSDDKKNGLLISMFSVFSAYLLFGAFQLGAWYFMWIIPLILLIGVPRKYLLSSLISFAALISFWKRVSFLVAIAISVYFLFLIIEKRRTHVQGAG